MVSSPQRGLVVRVLDPTGRTVGTGVLVGSREIVTCAHVVKAMMPLFPVQLSLLWRFSRGGIAVLLGVLFENYTANRAANHDPIVCLRYE